LETGIALPRRRGTKKNHKWSVEGFAADLDLTNNESLDPHPTSRTSSASLEDTPWSCSHLGVRPHGDVLGPFDPVNQILETVPSASPPAPAFTIC